MISFRPVKCRLPGDNKLNGLFLVRLACNSMSRYKPIDTRWTFNLFSGQGVKCIRDGGGKPPEALIES